VHLVGFITNKPVLWSKL